MQEQHNDEAGHFALSQSNGNFVPLLNVPTQLSSFLSFPQQVIGTEGATQTGVEGISTTGLSRSVDSVVARPLLMTESLMGVPVATPVHERRRAALHDSMTEEERVNRRRKINRDSQRRIRERRAKELEELRSEHERVRHENAQLLRQNECIAAEKAELLRQLQEITEKWQQTIHDNAVLNTEILQLKAKIEDLEIIHAPDKDLLDTVSTVLLVIARSLLQNARGL